MNFDERYGLLDRGLYRLAFRLGTAQHALADVEDLLYGDALDGITADDPVFITALPRAGTTILLKLLWETGRFASHTYQDMPFVLCPLLWSRYAGQFGTDIEATERAHGDGLDVSGRSPEAFEEMIWKHFWDEPYRADHIRPWTDADRNPEFERFLDIHEEDDFVREYMEAIGHHEFGKGLKPVNFNGWLDDDPDRTPESLSYWVRYWGAAYGFVLEHAEDNTVLVSYARLTDEPDASLARLADRLGIPAADLASQADRIETPRTHSVDSSSIPGTLLRQTSKVYEQLEQCALN